MKKKRLLKNGLVVLFLTAMVACAELLHEPEILFPEVLALLTGMWLLEPQPWLAFRGKLVLLMTAAAVAGVLCVRYVPGPVVLRVGTAFVFAAALLLAAHSTLLPILSACILPVLMGTTSWIYPAAVLAMCAAMAGVQLLLERRGLRAPAREQRWQYDMAQELARWSLLLAAVLPAAAGQTIGAPYVIAPPLVVLLVTLSFSDSPAARQPLRVSAVTVLCAGAGALCRWGLCLQLGLPQTASACAAAVLALAIFAAASCWFPPAGALAILPLLLPAAAMPSYPLQIAAGTAWFLLAGRGVRAAADAVQRRAQACEK